jgi:hypothetical protein
LQGSDERLRAIDTDGAVGQRMDSLTERVLQLLAAGDFGERAEEGGWADTVPPRSLPSAGWAVVLAVGLAPKGDGVAFVSGGEDVQALSDHLLSPVCRKG